MLLSHTHTHVHTHAPFTQGKVLEGREMSAIRFNHSERDFYRLLEHAMCFQQWAQYNGMVADSCLGNPGDKKRWVCQSKEELNLCWDWLLDFTCKVCLDENIHKCFPWKKGALCGRVTLVVFKFLVRTPTESISTLPKQTNKLTNNQVWTSIAWMKKMYIILIMGNLVHYF